MPPPSDTVKNAAPSLWQKIERIILLLTFIWASIGTHYSVRTSYKALAQAEVALRPWIAIPNVNTNVQATQFDATVELVNIGQVSAYARVSLAGNIDGVAIPQEDPERASLILALLPGQTILRNAVRVKDQTFREMRKEQTEHCVFQRILVEYGTKKSDLRYKTEKVVELKSADLKQLLSSLKTTGLWKLVEEDFK
jgi:hypothetical protein